jgi:hydroxymethylpyrimidine/phosphomethylpyrimidine kinase
MQETSQNSAPTPSGLAPGPRPCVVAIGGFDPSGGAGLARDLLAAMALGGHAILIGTAWTRQDERGARGIEPRQPEMLQAAIEHTLEICDPGRTAIKIGMTADRELISAIVSGLKAWTGPVVFDPVLGATSGGMALFRGTPADMLPLIRRAILVTPNLSEASWLLGRPVSTREDARVAARSLSTWGETSVLVKGGHLEGLPVDILAGAEGEQLFEGARLPGKSPRGTGCALATAIALGLASGHSLAQAVQDAKTWLAGRIAAASEIDGSRFL